MNNPFAMSETSPFGHSPMGYNPWGGFGHSMFNNPELMNTANNMRTEFVNMVDDRIREAMKHYFSTDEMPHFVKRAIKHLFHYEGKEHLGRAMKEMKHDMDKEVAEEEEEDEEEEEEKVYREKHGKHNRIAKFYEKILRENSDLADLPTQIRCDKLKERYPKMSNRIIVHMSSFLGQPDICSLAEKDGFDLESF